MADRRSDRTGGGQADDLVEIGEIRAPSSHDLQSAADHQTGAERQVLHLDVADDDVPTTLAERAQRLGKRHADHGVEVDVSPLPIGELPDGAREPKVRTVDDLARDLVAEDDRRLHVRQLPGPIQDVVVADTAGADAHDRLAR